MRTDFVEGVMECWPYEGCSLLFGASYSCFDLVDIAHGSGR